MSDVIGLAWGLALGGLAFQGARVHGRRRAHRLTQRVAAAGSTPVSIGVLSNDSVRNLSQSPFRQRYALIDMTDYKLGKTAVMTADSRGLTVSCPLRRDALTVARWAWADIASVGKGEAAMFRTGGASVHLTMHDGSQWDFVVRSSIGGVPPVGAADEAIAAIRAHNGFTKRALDEGDSSSV